MPRHLAVTVGYLPEPSTITHGIQVTKTNVGIPSGTVLTTYTGPGGFNGSGTVTINAKTVNDDLRIYDSVQLVVTNSKINGYIDCDYDTASVTLLDCEVDAGSWTNSAVGFRNLTIRRCSIHGGITSVNAAVNCLVEDTIMWGQYNQPGTDGHQGGFLCSGGHDITVRRCNVIVDTENNAFGGGPSNSVNLFGDFAPLDHITFDHTYIRATKGGYAAEWGESGKPYGDQVTRIVVQDCIFERGPNGKGGVFGTSSGFKATEPTNVWSNNTWEDTGTPVPYDG